MGRSDGSGECERWLTRRRADGNWAKFQGSAIIDGLEGFYPFRVDARDGGSQADRFIIKIYPAGGNPDTDEPIYKASGDLGGRQIKIHN